MSKDGIMNQDEVTRITALLCAAVKFSNVTQREVERKLGLSSGSLSRLFSGGIELKIKHVLDICEVIGLPPSRFFVAAYPEPTDDAGNGWRIQRLLEQLHPRLQSAPPALAPVVSPVQADIEQLVVSALRKLLGGSGAGAQSPRHQVALRPRRP